MAGRVGLELTLQLSHRPPKVFTRPRHPLGWFTQEYIVKVVFCFLTSLQVEMMMVEIDVGDGVCLP